MKIILIGLLGELKMLLVVFVRGELWLLAVGQRGLGVGEDMENTRRIWVTRATKSRNKRNYGKI